MNLNQRLKGLHILVVEDDPAGLDLVVSLLEFYGAKVTAARNGLEGLSFARALKPQLIIGDLSMPVMNGWQMIKELKQDQNTLDIPIIALTAHAMEGDREKVLAAGFLNYIPKPLDPYTFIDTLITIIADIPKLSTDIQG